MRGSKKSREKHIQEGTYHPSHHAPVKVGSRMAELSPTIELEGFALNFFFMVAEEMNEMELLKFEDMHLITAFAMEYDMIRSSYRALKRKGKIVKRKNGDEVVNPQYKIFQTSMAEFMKIAKSLGIGPLARQKLYDARIMGQEKETGLNLD